LGSELLNLRTAVVNANSSAMIRWRRCGWWMLRLIAGMNREILDIEQTIVLRSALAYALRVRIG